ncbi:MAG: hypothetical protein K5653_03830 [Clostridiales bacterium]|nr:hypothetical protein [Clostridiales bacterium]
MDIKKLIICLICILVVVSLFYFRSFMPFYDLKYSDVETVYDISNYYPKYILSEDLQNEIVDLLNDVKIRKTLIKEDDREGGDLGIEITLFNGEIFEVNFEEPYFIINKTIYAYSGKHSQDLNELEKKLWIEGNLNSGNWKRNLYNDIDIIKEANHIIIASLSDYKKKDDSYYLYFQPINNLKGTVDTNSVIKVSTLDDDTINWTELLNKGKDYLICFEEIEGSNDYSLIQNLMIPEDSNEYNMYLDMVSDYSR